MTSAIDDVKQDISELRKLGIRIPAKVDKWIANNPQEILEFDRNGMSTSEITDLVRSLAQ